MSVIYYHIKLIRPLNVLASCASIIIATAILDELTNYHILVLTTSIVMLFTGASNALNDALDYEIDLINRPRRPIPLGYVSITRALTISFTFFFFFSILCLQLPRTATIIGVFISLPLMIFYSTTIKGKYLFGNLVVALLLGLSFLFVGASHKMISPMLIPIFLAFGLTFLRELVKDIADVEGDNSLGLKTYPIVFGMKSSRNLVVVLCLLVGCGSSLPYLMGIYSLDYLLLLIIGVEIPLVIIVINFLKNPSISTAILSSRILKYSTLMGLLSIYFGAAK